MSQIHNEQDEKFRKNKIIIDSVRKMYVCFFCETIHSCNYNYNCIDVHIQSEHHQLNMKGKETLPVSQN